MNVLPSLQTTIVSSMGGEWEPASFSDFIAELVHIQNQCAMLNHYALYRGHARVAWRLDSTFARFVKSHILGINSSDLIRDEYRQSIDYHRLLSSLFLCKFGTLTGPSAELVQLSKENDIDPWFEWMKHIQQYPDNDITNLHGTFLIDWTQDWKIAVFFANYKRPDNEIGAVYIADMTQAGSILHRDLTVGEILDRMYDAFLKDQPYGCPLIFFPRQQISCQRATNQDAIYIAQMDLRNDLAEQWDLMDKERGDDSRILLRILLPRGTKQEAEAWLFDHGMTEEYIYPDRNSDNPNESN